VVKASETQKLGNVYGLIFLAKPQGQTRTYDTVMDQVWVCRLIFKEYYGLLIVFTFAQDMEPKEIDLPLAP